MTKKTAIRNEYTDLTINKEISYMIPIYISKICSVRFLDTDHTIKISIIDKNIYSYLCGIGYNQGYNSIYPNIDQIAYHLGMNEKTVRRSIKTLEECKLIKIVKMKNKGKFISNHYWIYRPNLIDRVQWLDIKGNVLIGRHYKFDYKQFHKTKDQLRLDKLLNGLIELTSDINNT